ncbi:MAG: VCBS repeat-containing protein [Myxococcales bacterium]|nr:VCBS repeat-containing protein [Myxococcales bacterium]
MRRSALPLAVAAVALACTDAPPPTPVATAPPFAVRAPDPFVHDIRRSEAAASAVGHDIGGALCQALRAEDAAGLSRVLTDDALGRFVEAPTPQVHDAALTTAQFAPAETVLAAPALIDALLAHRRRFAVLQRCSAKPYRFQLAPDARWAFARLKFELAGRDAEGKALTHRGSLAVEAARATTVWRARRLEWPDGLTEVRTLAAPFADVSAQTGVGLHRDAFSQAALTEQTDNTLIETIGGVAVVDFDHDGFDDLLAWNEHRTLQLLRNDGNGGFEKRLDLIPPAHVGVFHLFVDLDDDGVEELVSTAISGCTGDRARFPVYRRDGDRLVHATDLTFALDCIAPRRVAFQHIEPGDVDGDGRIDLFVSGFGDQTTRQGEYSRFDGQQGERNRLFINHGGLHFTEEAEARGLTGTRFTYVAAFYDHEGDGDRDLYLANDFGPNEVFLNDGTGHFTRLEGGPLVANGQSMGITVGDFDGDLDLDLYVSNMYSKAGNRIVPLVQDQLRPETWKALLGLARGNSLYAQTGPGQYEEQSDVFAVAQAGWAWGQAWFDADNDGDRDLYVVNGMTSNSTVKDDDF